jgi:DNA-binding MarR family transcriptional regulator
MRASGQDQAAAEALADRLHSLAIHLLRSVRREDAAIGLTGPRLSALSVVVFGGPLTLTALAAAEQVRPPTMTRIVQALVREGLVQRVSDPRDGRIVLVRATARGRSMLVRGRARRVGRIAGPVAALTPAERDTLRRAADILGRVVASLA